MVNISRRGLNDENVNGIYSELVKNTRCKVLNISFNNISEIGFEKVLKIVVNHPSLDTIIADGNNIGDVIFTRLKKWSSKLKRLKYFSFKNCRRLQRKPKVSNAIKGLKKVGIQVKI